VCIYIKLIYITEIFLFSTVSSLALQCTQSIIQRVPVGYILRDKKAKTWNWSLTPHSTKIKNARSYTSTPTSSWHGAYLSTGTTPPFIISSPPYCKEQPMTGMWMPKPHNQVPLSKQYTVNPH
jgi:hypothetical protein